MRLTFSPNGLLQSYHLVLNVCSNVLHYFRWFAHHRHMTNKHRGGCLVCLIK
nr:MAG TPA: hypothetical protein [Caudoviricetes sp.]